MIIKKIVTGSLKENCYVLINGEDCLVIDPGDDLDLIKKEINNYNLLAILITHYHFDHIGALDGLIKYKDVPIYDYKLEENNYNINGFNFDIIKTPGHTSDSVTFYFKNDSIMFVGDFVFKETIGRTDLPTGNEKEMYKSINLIKQYDDKIILYPGHGEETNIEYEKNNNYFFNIL